MDKACVYAGENDIGGTLMNESISRAADTRHGQEILTKTMEHLIVQLGRKPRQRDTIYRNANPLQKSKSFGNKLLVD